MNEIFQLKEKTEEKKRLETLLQKAINDLNELQEKLLLLKSQLKKEFEDIQKLEGVGLTSLFYSILGNKVEKLDKERQEYLSAKLKYENCQNEISELETEIEKIKFKISDLGDPETNYTNFLNSKSSLLKKRQDEQFRRFESQLEKQLAQKKELNEAIEAGEMALKGLKSAIHSLQKAKGWGTFDMLGGGLLATAIKHSNIDEAKSVILDVQVWLKKFKRELSDVQFENNGEIRIQLDSFSVFADYFFDNLIFDWVIQSQINRSLESCETIYRQVLDIVTQLRISDVEVTKKCKETKSEFTGYIENASV